MAEIENTSNDIKEFNTVCLYVVEKMTGSKIEEGRTYVKEKLTGSYAFSFIIRVTGKCSGTVIMSLAEKTALFLASAMMPKANVKRFDKHAENAIQELANMTISRAVGTIAGNREFFSITPPEFVQDNKISLDEEKAEKIFVTELNTPGGTIEFNISLFHDTGDFETKQKNFKNPL